MKFSRYSAHPWKITEGMESILMDREVLMSFDDSMARSTLQMPRSPPWKFDNSTVRGYVKDTAERRVLCDL